MLRDVRSGFYSCANVKSPKQFPHHCDLSVSQKSFMGRISLTALIEGEFRLHSISQASLVSYLIRQTHTHTVFLCAGTVIIMGFPSFNDNR